MIKIRYRNSNQLSPGLHAAAERHGRSTTVYLLSGLSAPERRAALRRLRLSARMGYCPRLPAAQLALALLADRIRTAIGQAGAVFRMHPAGSTVPVMVVSAGAIAFLALSTVSIRVLHNPRTASQSSASGTLPVASARAVPISGSPPGQAAGALGSPGNPGQPGSGSHGAQGGQGGTGQPGSAGISGSSLATSPGRAGPGTSGGSQGSGPGPGGGTTLTGGANPAPAPASAQAAAGTAPAASTAPASSPSSAAPKPAPSSTASSGGVCLDVGPLGICLSL
jgi:hypothetical protein